MNITTVLTEMKLNEGYFFSSKYKDKEGIIQAALQVIDKIFTPEFAKALRFGYDRVRFREMSTKDYKKKGHTSGYSNNVDVGEMDKRFADYVKQHPEAKDFADKLRIKTYKYAKKALNKQKIYLNTKAWKERDFDETRKIFTVIHEMIHTIQSYTPEIRKVENNILKIYKDNWRGPGDFSIAKINLGSDAHKDADRLSEIFTYIVSDRLNTEYLTEEGVDKLIAYLRKCGLINPNDEFGYWESKFEEMKEDNKAGQDEHN